MVNSDQQRIKKLRSSRNDLSAVRNALSGRNLLHRDIIHAEGGGQRRVAGGAELNADGLAGIRAKVEGPSQHVDAGRTFVQIAIGRHGLKQSASGVANLNIQEIVLDRGGGLIRCDVEPEVEIGRNRR